MVRVVIVMITLFSVITASLPRFQTETPDIPLDKAIYPNLIVSTLQSGCGTTDYLSTIQLGTSTNSVFLYMDESGASLCVNHSTLFKLPPPTNATLLNTSDSWGKFKFSGDKKQLIAACAEGRNMLLIDTRKRTFNVVGAGPCYGTPIWSDDERLLSYQTDEQGDSWNAYDVDKKTTGPRKNPDRTLSLDQNTEVFFDYKSNDEDGACSGKTIGTDLIGYYALINLRNVATGKETLLACAQARLSLISRVDDDRFVLLGSWSDTERNGLNELFLLNSYEPKLTSIGLVYLREARFEPSQYLIVPSENEAFFVKPGKIGDGNVPQDCALVSVELRTLEETTLEPTRCDYPADLTYLPVSGKVMYLQYAAASDSTAENDKPPVPTLKLLNVETGNISTLEAKGGIQQIATVSPNVGRYIMVIHDPTLDRSVRNFDNPDLFRDPHFTVYDSKTGESVYENAFNGSPRWRESFSWANDGNGFLFGYHGDYYVSLPDALAVQLDRGPLNCTWGRTTSCGAGFPSWSPGGRYLLVYTSQGMKVMRRSDNRMIPITKTVRENDYILTAYWSSDDKLIVQAFPQKNEPILMTLKRWLVDPALAR